MGIYVGSQPIQGIYMWEERPFTPSSDTIAYLPLEGNITDATGNTTPSLVRSDLISWKTTTGGKTYMFSDGANRSGTSNFNWNPSGGIGFTFSPKSLTNITINGRIMNKDFSGSDGWTWTTQAGIHNSGVTGGLGMNNSGANQSSRFAMINMQGASGDLITTTSPVPNTWYNLCVTQSGTTRKLYLDGVLLGSDSKGWTGTFSGGGINMAQPDSSGSHYGGSSEMIFESRVWSDSEVSTYFDATKAYYGK